MKKSLNCFVLLASLLLTCCTKEGDTIYQPNPNEEQPATTPLVTVIYGPNGLGDRSYNDLIYKGVEMAAKQYGLRTLQLTPESEAQGLVYLETMFRQMESASDTVRRLFITPSPVYDDFIRKNNKRLEKNPYADLLYMETTTPLEGKGSTFYIDYYGAMYMGGCMAQYCSNFLLSLILANPYTQTVVEAGEGFEAGFNDTPTVDPRYPITLHKRYLSNEPGSGFTIADSTATRIYKEECDYLPEGWKNNVSIVPVCGGAMHAFCRVVRSRKIDDNYVGIDGDLTDDTDCCPYAILKHIDKVMVDYVGMWLNGTMPKHQTLGLADGTTDAIIGYDYKWKGTDKLWQGVLDMDSLRQVAIRKEEERYER